MWFPGQVPLPKPDDLARLLGLEEWRIGKHSRPSGSFWVHHLWRVVGNPSSHPSFVLAGVQADDWIQKPGDGTVWRKATFACGSAAAVLPLELDAVMETLNRVTLIPPSDGGMTFDGIRYSVSLSSNELEGDLRFGNPRHPSLVALEKASCGLAQQIVKASANKDLNEGVRVWRSYCSRRIDRL